MSILDDDEDLYDDYAPELCDTDLVTRLFAYFEDIETGKIVSGIKTKQAVARFKQMYEKSQDSDNYYYFNEGILLDYWYFAYEFRHYEGVLEGQRVELTDFQLFQAAGILCFIKAENDARLVRKVYIQIGRKNSKSQTEGILGAYVAFIGKERQRIYIAGWGREQSDEVYSAIRLGIEHSELLRGKWTESYGKIKVLNNNSVIIPLSKEARKTGDGKNISVGILDEYHVHETSEIYDVLESGTGARREPLIIIITTAGFNLSAPCVDVYDYCTRLLNPQDDLENDEYFAMIYEMDKGDDIQDESNWMKANPIVCTYPEGIEGIRSALKTALEIPSEMRNFLTKRMNMWVDMADDGYLDLAKWNRQERPSDELDSIIETGSVYLGVDLAATTDLTSVAIVAVNGGTFAVRQHSFVPSEKFKERMSRDKVRYDVFRDQGFMTLTDGDVVDYDVIKNYIAELCDRYDVKEILYDPWNATHLVTQLTNEGYPMIEMPQRITTLSDPTKQFRAKLYEGKIIHENDGLLKWAVGNAVTRTDANENIMLDKAKARDRIDPIAAAINGFGRCMHDDLVQDLNEYFMSDGFGF